MDGRSSGMEVVSAPCTLLFTLGGCEAYRAHAHISKVPLQHGNVRHNEDA